MLTLSIDGGGVRGAMQCGILKSLDSRTGFLGNVRSFAGTSIGSFIAAALAFDVPPSDLIRAFLSHGCRIFDRPGWHNISNPMALRTSKYDNKKLHDLVVYFFGDKVFGDLSKKTLLITTYGLDVQKNSVRKADSVICTNFGPKATHEKSVAEAVMQSMAMPSYFPVFNNTIDGGIFANNPSTSVLCELIRSHWSIEKLWMLSLGSGENPIRLNFGSERVGLWRWLTKGKLLDLLRGSATTGSNHYYTETILQDRYFRIQPTFQNEVEVDRWEDIPWLIREGLEMPLEDAVGWLKDMRKKITLSKAE